MSYFKQLLLSNWHVMRIVRLALGVGLMVGFVVEGDWILLMASAVLLFQAIFNVGCASGGCYTPPRYNRREQDVKEIEYKEIK